MGMAAKGGGGVEGRGIHKGAVNGGRWPWGEGLGDKVGEARKMVANDFLPAWGAAYTWVIPFSSTGALLDGCLYLECFHYLKECTRGSYSKMPFRKESRLSQICICKHALTNHSPVSSLLAGSKRTS